MPNLFEHHPDVEPIEIPWGQWLRIQYHNRTRVLHQTLRHPLAAFQRRTRLPLTRRAFALAVRTHLGRVDVRAMREALMYLEEDDLVRYAGFGPAPRGLDETFEEASAFSLAFDEWMIRLGHCGGHDDWALALRWMARGEPRTAAWVRVRIDLAEHRPPDAIPVTRDTPEETS